MAKRKLLIKDKEEILKIIAKYLDNKELKNLKEELFKKQTEFEKYINDWYCKEFKITKELLDFANKYNIFSTVYECKVDNNNYRDTKEPLTYFNGRGYYGDDFYCQYYNFSFNLKLPYYDKLNYIKLDNDFSCYENIRRIYKEFVDNICNKIHEKSKEVYKVYKEIKNIINSSDYVEDFENIIEIQEVTDFINQRFINKKSTALCALNKEKIDFVKNYLTSLK